MSIFNYLKTSKLEIGNYYELYYSGNYRGTYFFVKSTPKGYNFIGRTKGKFLFKKHIYPIKNMGNGDNFYINKELTFKKIHMKETGNNQPEVQQLQPRAEFEREIWRKRFNDVCVAISGAYTKQQEIKVEWINEYNELINKIK